MGPIKATIISLLTNWIVYSAYIIAECPLGAPSVWAFLGLFSCQFVFFFWRTFIGNIQHLPKWAQMAGARFAMRTAFPRAMAMAPIRKTVSIMSVLSIWFLNLKYDFDMYLFLVVTYAVYYWTCRTGCRKKKLEDNKPGTFSDWTFWQMLSSGIKVGGILAGLADLGLKLMPKDFQAASVIADLFKAISEFLRCTKRASEDESDLSELKKTQEKIENLKVPGPEATWGERLKFWRRTKATPVNSAQEMREAINKLPVIVEGEDEIDQDDEIEHLSTWTQSLVALRGKIKEIMIRHRARFAWFFAAVIAGVVIYCLRHNRAALESAMEGQKRGQKGGNSAKPKKARGKNRGGKVSGSKDFWAYYDQQDIDAIIDVYVNGNPVGASYIKRGQRLDPGDYVVVKQYGNRVVEEVFTVRGVKTNILSAPNDDLAAMAARRGGGKAPMTISGKRAKELGFEAAVLKQVGTQYFHSIDCDGCDDEDCSGCTGDCVIVDTRVYKKLTFEPKVVLHDDSREPLVKGSVPVKESTEPIADNKGLAFKPPIKPVPKAPKVEQVKKPLPAVPAATKIVVSVTEGQPPLTAVAGKTATKKRKEEVKAAQEANKKLEALVASSPKLDIRQAEFRIELLDKEGDYVSTGTVAWCGIICNEHAYQECTDFSFAGKKIPKTKIWYTLPDNKDIIVAAFYDGCPKPVPKKHFTVPEEGQASYLIDAETKVCRGIVMSVSEQGPLGLQARSTYSSEPGDCGCSILNSNGSIIGIHFSAGRPKVDNLFYPVGQELLKLNPKAPAPLQRDS